MSLQQPARTPKDGAMSVSRHPLEEGVFIVTVTHEGREQDLVVGGFNAWRVFGALALLLGIPLPQKVGKAIKFGEPPPEITLEHPKPKTLGERVAQNLVMHQLEKAGKVRRKK